MTTIATQDHTRSRLRSPQTRLLIVLALLAVAGVLFVWIVTGGGGTASHSLGGPNEAARGGADGGAPGGPVAPAERLARGPAGDAAPGGAPTPAGGPGAAPPSPRAADAP